MRDFYIIVYDVVKDKRRVKVAKLLESLGERVQYSVFELYIKKERMKTIKKQLEKQINLEEDRIRIYALCAACRKNIVTLGEGDVSKPPGDVIIV